MSELELYKKMYAKVFSEADGVLQNIAGALGSGDCSREKLMEIGERLKQALLDAEEMYISEGGEEDGDAEADGGSPASGLLEQPL